jgi:hypothetical protein
MTILRLIFAMALFYVAVAENIRGAAKPKLDLGDVQQGDILNAMERFTRALSKGASGLQLPDNFKKADGSFISIPHSMEVISEAEAKRKLATPVAPTKCDGDGASEIQTITVNSMDMSFNFNTNPVLYPAPTTLPEFTTLATSIPTVLTSGASLCMFLNVDVGQQGLNWDTATKAVKQADIDLSDAAIFEATCTNCYAEMGGAITYKASCTINSLTPADSACNVQMFVGGGVKFGLDMSITKLNFDGQTVDKQLITGTKQQVFYDPQTSITISVTPALSVSFEGSAVSTGSLRVQTSMDSQVSVGLTFVLPAATFDVGFAGDITLVPPTITSDLEMDTYDLTVSVVPNLLWTIGAGQMVTAPVLSANPLGDDNVAATGMAVEVVIPNPMSFNWQFTKTASDVTSKATATVGFAVSTMNAYLAANWYYTGSTASMDKPAPLYDYSQWLPIYFGAGDFEANWPLYPSPDAATPAPLGADVPGAVSLTTSSTPPVPAPAPALGGNTSSSGDAKTGMSGGEVAALVIGLLVAIALGYYGYNHYMSKAAQDDAYTGLNAGLDTKINA